MTDFALHLLRFQEGTTQELSYPLKEVPTFNTTLHSPRVGKQGDLKNFDFTKYEEYLKEIIDVRLKLGKGEYPFEFLAKYYPKAWGRIPSELPECLKLAGVDTTHPDTCATLVRMDLPNDLGVSIMRWLNAKGALKLKQGSRHFNFLGTFPSSQAEMAKKISEALEAAFDAKYYFGVARPSAAHAKINKVDGTGVEAYAHPTHPSYPAGHGAAAGATAKFFYDNFDLETNDWIDIRNAAYLFAMYRSLAGVHYAVDNLAGLQVGGLDVGFGSI